MSDNKNLRTPADSSRINLNESYEVSYWTKSLNISKDELQKIIRRVGPMVNDVRNALNKTT